ncbi:signal peptidase I [Nocardioides sp. W3-2-3]|nr:signal peptidase I [Nocardioides convexus]
MTTDETAGDETAPGHDDAAAGDQGPRHSEKTERKHLPVWQESILLLAVALGLAVVIKAVFVRAFYIPSESMEPGLVKNDRILVQKVSYWFGGSPKRGDVIVFEDPGQWLGETDDQGPTGFANLLSKVGLYPTGGHLVKRVIGTEGDVVVCCDKQGRIEVNGVAIDEKSYLGPDPGACNAEFARRLAGPQGLRLRGALQAGPSGRSPPAKLARARRQPRALRRLAGTPVQPRRRPVHQEPVGGHRHGRRQGLHADLAA